MIAQKHFCICGASLLLLTALSARAAGTNEFLTRIYTNTAGKTLPYRLLLPKIYETNQAYPLIVYLHGAAARGNDNQKPLSWGPELFLEPSLREKHQFFLLVPQCPSGGTWIQSFWSGLKGTATGDPLGLTLDLAEHILPKEFNLDPSRRYLTGVSMGGHAVWMALARRPGFFAAAVPVCSGGSSGIITDAVAKSCPVWAFHSDDDPLVPVQQVRELVKVWREHGGAAKYTEYTGLKHGSWRKAYTEMEMFEWLFQQQTRGL